ncbi:MAG: Ribonuclease HII [Methanomassiliicoccales archaeon PtaU1.Bin124]|nr:MAG: Ribonuclease HII [Methanomassiliicoccales archaeon PtaU1.Bin124]
MLCGMDEAGRGPVIGPLVIAGVMVADEAPLREMGVRDSKKLTPARRSELDVLIRKVAKVDVEVIDALTIDARGEGSLNDLELDHFAMIIERMRPTSVFADACDPSESAFHDKLSSRLKYVPEMTCRHKADDLFPCVSAASIVAKVLRDRIVEQIAAELGEEIGSGYPADPTTRAFLKRWIKEKRDFPPHTRKSWKTCQEIRSETLTRKITDWE